MTVSQYFTPALLKQPSEMATVHPSNQTSQNVSGFRLYSPEVVSFIIFHHTSKTEIQSLKVI